MKYQNHRPAHVRQPAGHRHDFQLVPHIQIGGGLVHKDRLRVLGQRHGKIHLLPLASAELLHGAIGQVARACPFQGFLRGLIVLRPVAARVSQVRKASVQHHSPGGDAGNLPGLGQIGRFTGHLASRQVLQAHAVVKNFSALPGQEAQSRFHQGALAAAVGPQQHRHLSRREDHGNLPEHRLFAVAHGQLFQLNHEAVPSFAATR